MTDLAPLLQFARAMRELRATVRAPAAHAIVADAQEQLRALASHVESRVSTLVHHSGRWRVTGRVLGVEQSVYVNAPTAVEAARRARINQDFAHLTAIEPDAP